MAFSAPGLKHRLGKNFGEKGRDWLVSRDLGVGEATNGAYGGQIARARELGHSTGPHWHKMAFQMVFVLKGCKILARGGGRVRLRGR